MHVVLIVDYSVSQRQPETKNTGVKYRFAMAETTVVSALNAISGMSIELAHFHSPLWFDL